MAGNGEKVCKLNPAQQECVMCTFSEGCTVCGEKPDKGGQHIEVGVFTLQQVTIKVVVMDTDLMHQ